MTPGFDGAGRAAVTRPRPVADASLRLFCFHHAGGSHQLFRGWENAFPPEWDICLVDAPGRGRLHAVPALESAEEAIDFFLDVLTPWMERPFAFFGHSMGALLAYELTGRLVSQRRNTPVWLGLSACGAPQLTVPTRGRHLLADHELRAWLKAVGGTPTQLLEDDALWRFFAPVFRSDFALVDTWRPHPDAPRLPVPVAVFGGSDDPVVGPERLRAWADRTRSFLGLHLYRGGHFYLHAHQSALARRIVMSTVMASRIRPLPTPRQ